MPIYEYECEKCGAIFERLCRSTDDDATRCPECDADDCRRLVSRVAASGAKKDAGHSCHISSG
jgi:putative FmdB family regulatory protein